jgi:hypothetical protein
MFIKKLSENRQINRIKQGIHETFTSKRPVHSTQMGLLSSHARLNKPSQIALDVEAKSKMSSASLCSRNQTFKSHVYPSKHWTKTLRPRTTTMMSSASLCPRNQKCMSPVYPSKHWTKILRPRTMMSSVFLCPRNLTCKSPVYPSKQWTKILKPRTMKRAWFKIPILRSLFSIESIKSRSKAHL